MWTWQDNGAVGVAVGEEVAVTSTATIGAGAAEATLQLQLPLSSTNTSQLLAATVPALSRPRAARLLSGRAGIGSLHRS